MKTRITRPTLAELWRHLLARLERQGVEDAPALARSLAVAALTRQTTAQSPGLRVHRRGDRFTVTSVPARKAPGTPRGVPGRVPSPRWTRVLATS